jgi:hypothetical protein
LTILTIIALDLQSIKMWSALSGGGCNQRRSAEDILESFDTPRGRDDDGPPGASDTNIPGGGTARRISDQFGPGPGLNPGVDEQERENLNALEEVLNEDASGRSRRDPSGNSHYSWDRSSAPPALPDARSLLSRHSIPEASLDGSIYINVPRPR